MALVAVDMNWLLDSSLYIRYVPFYYESSQEC
jgi:hypothetical protein